MELPLGLLGADNVGDAIRQAIRASLAFCGKHLPIARPKEQKEQKEESRDEYSDYWQTFDSQDLDQVPALNGPNPAPAPASVPAPAPAPTIEALEAEEKAQEEAREEARAMIWVCVSCSYSLHALTGSYYVGRR